MIKIIAAKSMNDVIGINNELPWIISEDLVNFKRLTTPNKNPNNNIIVMGWNTWQSIGEKPLPNRINVIISRQRRVLPRSRFVKLLNNPQDVLTHYNTEKQNIAIIGGESIFRYFLPLADELYLTNVLLYISETKDDVVAKFPKLNSNWSLVSKSRMYYSHDDTPYEFSHFKNLT